jgi:putative flavoprotein involved in K+ transport
MRPRRHVLDAVVVGGGFAGLAVSGALKSAGLSHMIFERNRPCQTWLTQRWDSFRMNTPNVLTVMPGEVYRGPEPEGAMTRDEFVASALAYAARKALPVESGTAVTTVEPDDRDGFAVHTPQGAVRARNVIATTGNLNVPKRPEIAARLPRAVTQIDGSDYRSVADLRPGAVLVIGCGNSGGQIAEDLALAGREVFLATGRNGRVPRRYRGRDIILWLMETGRYDLPRSVQSGRPLLGATHTISLGSLSVLGIALLGRLADVTAGGTLILADDLAANAAHADEVSADIRGEIDDYIARAGIDAEAATVDPAAYSGASDHAFRRRPIADSGVSGHLGSPPLSVVS